MRSKDSVDVTDNTQSLVRQLTDNTKLALRPFKKLNNAVSERLQAK
jgi:type I restriction enzyme R subunit